MKPIYIFLSIIIFTNLDVLSATEIPKYVPKTALIAWYPFNGNANDESGGNNHLTVQNATLSTDRFGVPNACYFFDGINACLYRDAITTTSLSKDFTISCWVNMRSYPSLSSGGASFVSNGFGRTKGTGVKYDSNCVEIITFGNQFNSTKSTFKPELNTWYNYVVTRKNDTYTLNVNGDDKSHAKCTTNEPEGYFVIGAVRGHVTDSVFSIYFDGQIDDVGFWNRGLSLIEVDRLYRDAVGGIEEDASPTNMAIYPNPAKDQITFQTPENVKGSNYVISNYLGSSLLTGEVIDNNTTIDVSGLPNGIYFIRLGTSLKMSFTIIKD